MITPEATTKKGLILIFVILGIVLMAMRSYYLGSERILTEDTAWKISLYVQFDAEKDHTQISTPRPKSGKHTKLISQRIFHPGLKVQASKISTGNIKAKAVTDGISELLIDYHILLSPDPLYASRKNKPLPVEEREKYLKSEPYVDLTLPELLMLNDYLSRNINTKPELLEQIVNYSTRLVKDKNPRFDLIKNIISANRATSFGRAKIMLALLRINDIPARIITGFVLEKKPVSIPYYWVELYDDEGYWKAYDPEKNFRGEVPYNYVVANINNPEIVSIVNGSLLNTKITLSEDPDILEISRLAQDKSFWDILDLRRLDLENRQTLIKILILPFCVLLTAVFRNILGFFPYGTFTASLLALSMVFAEQVVTLTISGIVILLALIGRSFLPKTLSRTPRLSLIFTFVAIAMVLSISVMEYFDMNPGSNVILIPTIILVAVVDRFYSYMDKAGTHAALIRLGVTIMIALFCIPILQFEALGQFILTYPEAHMITAALVLSLSYYKGSKLTDYKYLRLLGENKIVKKKTSKASQPTDEDSIL